MSHPVLTIIFGLLLFPAIFLVFIPMLPAFLYMFAVAFLYGILDGFVHLQAGEIGMLAGIFCLSVLVDYSAGALGAKYGGASKKSIVYGFVGLLLGSVLFPPFGGLPGLFFGVFITELFFLRKSRAAAWKAAAGSFLGSMAGVVFNVILALCFFTLFLVLSLS